MKQKNFSHLAEKSRQNFQKFSENFTTVPLKWTNRSLKSLK